MFSRLEFEGIYSRNIPWYNYFGVGVDLLVYGVQFPVGLRVTSTGAELFRFIATEAGKIRDFSRFKSRFLGFAT